MSYILPVSAALFVWWFSTGIVMLLDGLGRRTYVWSMLGATCLAALAVFGLYVSAWETTVVSAYIAFVAAIVVWGWHELAFLLGIITGSRRSACPADVSTGRRFVLAFQALVYHEVAVAATLGFIVLLLWNAPNKVGLWTFLVLFGMRLSAKLNIFLGVPNMTEEFLPRHMDFLKSYFARRPMNWLFPISVLASTLMGSYVFHAAFLSTASAFEVAGFMLIGALILLGMIEHWLLVLPIPESALWRWAMQYRKGPEAANDTDQDSMLIASTKVKDRRAAS